MEKLPSDIFVNIVSRLPLKSVIQSSCVSKSWHRMIKDPSFVKLFISRSDPDPSLLVLTRRVVGERNIISIQPMKIKDYQLVVDEWAIDHIASSYSWDLVGTCNGLLCFTSSGVEEVSVICNPVTREHVSLPKPDTMPLLDPSYVRMLGFGFDPVKEKYKVVRVIYHKRPVLHENMFFAPVLGHQMGPPAADTEAVSSSDIQFEVYTLADTNSWKEVNGFDYYPTGKPVHANGVLYWLLDGLDLDNRILSFELASEQFKLTPHRHFGRQISLAELGGCLSVVEIMAGGPCMSSIEISVLRNPVNNIWEVKYILPSPKPRSLNRLYPRLIGVQEVGSVLLVWLQDRLLSYDSRVFRTKDLKLAGFPSWLDWEICSGFKGNLVPLNSSHAAGGDQRDSINFLSEMELIHLLANGGPPGEQTDYRKCTDIIASFKKNGLLI